MHRTLVVFCFPGKMGAMVGCLQARRLGIVICLIPVLSACRDRSAGKDGLDLVGVSPKAAQPSVSPSAPSSAKQYKLGVDLIQDLVFRNQRDGWTLTTPNAHVNVDKLKTAGINLVFSALPQSPSGGMPNKRALMRALDNMDAMLIDAQGKVEAADSFQAAEKIAADGRIAVMLLVEGADVFEDDFTLLKTLKNRGLVMVGLVAARSNTFADAAVSRREEGGLTEKGRRFLEALRNLGITVDLTHASKQTFWDVATEQSGAVIVSHSAARALMDHPRNLDDLQILGLKRYGGLLGILFNPEFLVSKGNASMDDVVAHIMHVKALGAVSNLALGTDFDGIVPPRGLDDIAALPKLKDALSGQGMTDSEIQGIFGGNAVRFFRAASSEFGAQEHIADEILHPLDVECEFISGPFEGRPASSCNGYVRDFGTVIPPSSRHRVRLRDMASSPATLEIFGDPGVPWQMEAQNLEGKILFHRIIQLDADGNSSIPLPADRKLARLFLSPTRISALKEVVIWGRAPLVAN